MNKEYNNENKIKCPYCDYEFSDSCDYGDHWDHGNGVIECDSCEEDFNLSINVRVDYSTSVIDCEDGEHEWMVAQCIVIDQKTLDEWANDPIMRIGNKERKPHDLWIRECKICTEKEYKEPPLNSKDPWAEQKNNNCEEK